MYPLIFFLGDLNSVSQRQLLLKPRLCARRRRKSRELSKLPLKVRLEYFSSFLAQSHPYLLVAKSLGVPRKNPVRTLTYVESSIL